MSPLCLLCKPAVFSAWRAFFASASRSAISLSIYSFFTLFVSALLSGRPCAIRARSNSVFNSRCSRSVISFCVMRGSAMVVPSIRPENPVYGNQRKIELIWKMPRRIFAAWVTDDVVWISVAAWFMWSSANLFLRDLCIKFYTRMWYVESRAKFTTYCLDGVFL
ncbi:Uncharacterised protein [Klebsiella aerogenes]|nr:Uncharacterised protein [Klebsiella aerogenes]